MKEGLKFQNFQDWKFVHVNLGFLGIFIGISLEFPMEKLGVKSNIK